MVKSGETHRKADARFGTVGKMPECVKEQWKIVERREKWGKMVEGIKF